jgi:hypothetical protein
MTCIDTTSKRRLPAKLAAGIAISALLVLGTGIGTARAEGGWDRQENHHHSYWTGGYYRAPPVVYGYGGGYYGGGTYYAQPAPSYYYAPPPPVYYGSGVGISLPGINFNIH